MSNGSRIGSSNVRRKISSLITQHIIIAGFAGLFAFGAASMGGSVLFFGAFCALAMFAIVVTVGLVAHHSSAYKASALTPYLSLLIWFVPATVISGFVGLVLNGMGGTRVDTLSAVLLYYTIAAVPLLPVWLVMTVHYRRTREDDELQAACKDRPGTGFLPGIPVYAKVVIIAALYVVLLAHIPIIGGKRLIHEVAGYGWTPAVAVTIGLGGGVNARTAEGWTPLHFAADNGRVRTVDYLLRHGADINVRDKDGYTAVTLAAMSSRGYGLGTHFEDSWMDRRGAFDLLVRRGANLKLMANDGSSALDILSGGYSYDQKLVHMLVEHGAPLNNVKKPEDALIATVVGSGTIDEVEYLLAHGAKLTPDLVFYANSKMLRYLVSKGLELNVRDDYGATLLGKTVNDGSKRRVQLLLQLGADPNITDSNGQTPLHQCCNHRHLAEILLKAGANPNALDKDHRTPLHYAFNWIDTDDPTYAVVLLKYGANPNIRDKSGETPLHKAAKEGREKGARLLLRYGARADIKNSAGKTPRDLAQFKL